MVMSDLSAEMSTVKTAHYRSLKLSKKQQISHLVPKDTKTQDKFVKDLVQHLQHFKS